MNIYELEAKKEKSVILPIWKETSTEASSTVNSGVYSFGGRTSVTLTETTFNPPSQRLSPVFPLEGQSTNGFKTAIIDFQNLEDVEINYTKHKSDEKTHKKEK